MPWAESFIQARRVVAVRMDLERGEYEALCENGSSYFIERLEQAEALRVVLASTMKPANLLTESNKSAR